MKELEKFLTAILLLVLTLLINGFVFMKLWCWLLVPTLHMQQLTFIQSVCISFFIRTVTNRFNKKINIEEESVTDILNDFITWLVYIGLALSTGFVITQFL